MKNRVELLAPAGNTEGFYGAIHAGADAVYLGGSKFGARAYAQNFTQEELASCIRYAHLFGRRVYLTVNTLVKDKEWDQLHDYILPYYEAGLDGVIIQDMGVFLCLKEHFPGMELHVSTQMTLTGSHGAAYMKELGASRIVPARELSLQEIKQIKEDTGLEIECFIHGAMCYCYSGQCLFSSILGGRSGNRGRCAQPCRLPYQVNGGKECYPLSLKDMCTAEYLPQLIEAGIDSFKIEGRMKKPEYAAGVTAIYRKIIDRYEAGSKHCVTAKELQELSSLYIRSERQDGYYHKHNSSDMVTLENPAYSGSDEALLQQIRKKYIETMPKIDVDLYGQFATGMPARLTMVSGEVSVTVTGSVTEAAQRQPMTKETAVKQLTKLGDTSFTAQNVWIEIEGDCFVPMGALNELRRRAVYELENALMEKHGLCAGRVAEQKQCLTATDEVSFESSRKPSQLSSVQHDISATCDGQFAVSITTKEQLEAVPDYARISRLYLDADMVLSLGTEALKQMLPCVDSASCPEIYLTLPYILRKRDKQFCEKVLALLTDSLYSGCMVRSLEEYAWCKKAGYCGKLVSDAGFYIWNQKTLAYWQERLDGITLPLELNSAEQRDMCRNASVLPEKIVYGYLPMMITANCVQKTTGQCHGSGQWLAELTDRYRKHLPVRINCDHCMNVIYNSVPLSLHGSVQKWQKNVLPRLTFTVEDGRETRAVIDYYSRLLRGEQGILPCKDYTTGHEKRGVE